MLFLKEILTHVHACTLYMYTHTCRPISDDNVGRRMLKKLGWKEGQGLGKEGTGMAEPVSQMILLSAHVYERT